MFGPKKLPKMSKALGSAVAEFRRAFDGIKEGIEKDIKTNIDEIKSIPASLEKDQKDLKERNHTANGEEKREKNDTEPIKQLE